METAPARTIKGYDVRERIGGGGMGDVFRAYQSTIGREVAIKIIKPALANQPDFIRRFDTEAQLVARLEHPHIVPLFDYWRDPTGAYLVMRLLRGGSLADALAQGAYDLESTANLLDQIASALTVAHRSNVVHRDIKPANILLDEDGNAYLTDFGIAKELETDAPSSTAPDGFIGSPDYLSPEQARNDALTARADIYSLGVVLYETLTGQHPFPELSAVERLFAHLNEPLPDITALDDQLAPAINAVVQRATAKNPANRYADVMALAQAFREAAALRISRIEPSLVELLTPREQEVLHLLVEGKSNREIAAKLTVELATVKWYIYQLYQKLNVRSRVQAIVKARELNLIVSDFTHVDATTTGLGAVAEPQNPFKGLRAFQPADEQDFFGRERLIKHLLKRLGEKGKLSRFLAVVGPSGSGKSSLVKAGLIPALWRGEHPGSDKWFVAEMTPGAHPLDEMEVALVRVATRQTENLHEQLARDERGLVRAAQIVLPNDEGELLLIIDQFEEVFTLLEDEDERQHFLNLIVAAVTDPRSRVRVIVTLRADFYDRPLHYAEFGQLIQNRAETVLPMGAEELEQAIAKPARRVGVKFEEGLVASIISEVNYQPGALPLLQYALTELFENRTDHQLTHEAYQKIGGTTGALASRAEEIYNEAGDAYREAARQMFLRMVTLGEGVEDTRRRVPRSELLAVTSDTDVMDDVIDTFAAYRLLALDHDPATRKPTVEVAHEALLREWERLRGWLNESRADIRLQRQLAGAVHDWNEGGKDPSFLLRGARLDQFEGWRKATGLALTPREQEYLETSLIQRDQDQAAEAKRQAREVTLEKRSRLVLRALVGVFAAAAVISGGLAIWANQQRQEALRQASMGLAAQARLEQVEGQPERAVLLALEALENYPYTWQAERALFGAVTENRLLKIMTGHTQTLEDINWSPDGSLLVSTSDDGTAIIWDAESGEARFTLRHESPVYNAAFSPDGALVASSSIDGTAGIWNAATGERLHLLRGTEAEMWRSSWSPDGTRVATASADGPGQPATARVWDATTGEELLILRGHTDAVSDVAWSPDGKSIATAGYDHTARIWDATSGKELFVLTGHADFVRGVSWSPDGSQLATASEDGSAIVWDTKTGEPVFTLAGEGVGIVVRVLWSPDGSRLLTIEQGLVGGSTLDGVASIWDMATGQKLHRLSVPGAGKLWMAAWSPDGKRLAIPDDAALIRIWDAETGEQVFTLRGGGILILNLAWSPDGSRLAAQSDERILIWSTKSLSLLEITGQTSDLTHWSPDGRTILRADLGGPLVIMDSETGETVKTLPVPESTVISATWSPDGTRISTTHNDGSLRVWDYRSGEEQWSIQFEANSLALFWDPDWSPDGKRIAVSDSTRGYVLDAITGDKLHTLDPGVAAMFAMRWSHDGTRVAVAGDPGTWNDETPGGVYVWDAASGEEVLSVPFDGVTVTVDWSPDDKRLLVSKYGFQHIIDAETGATLLQYSGQEGAGGGDWSPNGEHVVSFTSTGVGIWDPNTGDTYAEFNVDAWTGGWSPDGTRLTTLGPEGVLRVWRVFPDTQSLIDYAKQCCILRQLTPEERTQFGLPSAPGQPQTSGSSALPAVSISFGLACVGLVIARRRMKR